jgi:manganese transport protein
MPHVIYLHSALTQNRLGASGAEGRRVLVRSQRSDVLAAMSVAGLINMSMLVIAAALFRDPAVGDVASIEAAYAALGQVLDREAALAFGLALLASGLASSSVGTYAGQVVMQGFIQRRIPLGLRRAVTMAPAMVVLTLGVDPTRALVISQVVLSFGIPFALIPLVLLTRDPAVMGPHVNGAVTTALATIAAALVTALNLFLLGRIMVG